MNREEWNSIVAYIKKQAEKTIEAPETKTAEWSYYNRNDETQSEWWDVQTCSKCGIGGKNYDEFGYCPHCGRLMSNSKQWGNRWKVR